MKKKWVRGMAGVMVFTTLLVIKRKCLPFQGWFYEKEQMKNDSDIYDCLNLAGK